MGLREKVDAGIAITESQKRRLVRQEKYAAIGKLRVDDDWSEDLSRFNSHSIRQVGKNPTRSIRPARNSSNSSPELLHWRESVLLRDGYKCVWCGSEKRLEADHIQPQHIYPDLRYDVSNGRTLCRPCHTQTSTYGSKVKRLTQVSVELDVEL